MHKKNTRQISKNIVNLVKQLHKRTMSTKYLFGNGLLRLLKLKKPQTFVHLGLQKCLNQVAFRSALLRV